MKRRNNQLPGILIIGVGNRLRGDDGAGVVAAVELETHFRGDDEVEIVAAQQLLPEMAERVAHSSFVLFLDACDGQEPGTIRSVALQPHGDASGWTHHLTPGSLLNAAQQIYGLAPAAECLTIAGWSFAVNNELSSGVRQRLPDLIRQAKELVATHR